MKSFLRGAILVLAASVAAACFPTSIHPIGTTAPAAIDARLLGAWKLAPKGKEREPNYIFFIQRDKGELEALMVGAPESDDGGWMSFSIKTARLKGKDFLSARILLDDGKPLEEPDYTPVYYRLDGKNTLHLYVLGAKAIGAAIGKGQIKGEVKKLTYGDEVKITAAPKALDAFFASHDPKTLFTDELGTYTRMK
ncbi:MAG: hypothetical protein ACT4OG_09870 [Alphaproteobacteria bacterium]